MVCSLEIGYGRSKQRNNEKEGDDLKFGDYRRFEKFLKQVFFFCGLCPVAYVIL